MNLIWIFSIYSLDYEHIYNIYIHIVALLGLNMDYLLWFLIWNIVSGFSICLLGRSCLPPALTCLSTYMPEQNRFHRSYGSAALYRLHCTGTLL